MRLDYELTKTTPVSCRFVFAAFLLSAPATTVYAQQPALRDPALFHDRVVRVIHQLASRQLPAGDTLVTWTSQPVLFHTSAIGTDTARAGLLRGDRMLGTATVTWAIGEPTTFAVEWTTPGKPTLDIRGVRRGTVLRITGTHDTVLHVPVRRWAVADYGMEALLIPLLRELPRNAAQRIAVFRPFGMHWDTLTAMVRPQGATLIAELRDAQHSRTWMVIGDGQHLLWLHQQGQEMERRPLEGTARYAEYARIRDLLADLR